MRDTLDGNRFAKKNGHTRTSTDQSSTFPSCTPNEQVVIERYLSSRIRIYHFCVIITSVLGLILIASACLIYYIDTGFRLKCYNRAKHIRSNYDLTAQGFFRYAKWLSLGLMITGVLLLFTSITLCCLHRYVQCQEFSTRTEHTRQQTISTSASHPKLVVVDCFDD